MTRTLHILAVIAVYWLGACGRDAAPRLDTLHGSDALASPAARNTALAPMATAGASQLTERGIGPLEVGLTLAEARAATAGALAAPPAADTAAGGRPASAVDSAYRTIFETNAIRVTTFRAGRLPEVDYIEGCG